MLKSSLEKLVKSGYQRAILRKYDLDLSEEWINALLKVIETLGVTEETLSEAMSGYYPGDEGEDTRSDILLHIIYSTLPDSNLWYGIVRIYERTEDTPYYTFQKYTIEVEPKESQLEGCSSEWTWKNNEEVSEFMSPDNKLYELLKSLDGMEIIEK